MAAVKTVRRGALGNKNWEYSSCFKEWLQEVEEKGFDYIAAISRRATNIIEIIRTKYGMPEFDFLTENGLLMRVEEIVEAYLKYQYFPDIVVLDDVLVHGRNLNSFFERLWKAVRQCLLRRNKEHDMEQVEKEFNRSITLWVFAVNDDFILLRHEFQRKMYYQRFLPESQWRKLSDSIATYIWEEEIANTSYIISARIRKPAVQNEQIDDQVWTAERWSQYRGRKQDFYLFCLSPREAVYPGVRCYDKGGYRYYTPYCFTPEMESQKVLGILKRYFSHVYEQKPGMANRFIRLLNETNRIPARREVYSQLLYLLLSQATLKVFLNDEFFLTKQDELEYDFEKIARNFGNTKEVQELLRQICLIEWTRDDLKELLECLELEENIDEVLELTEEPLCSVEDSMEHVVYEQAVNHERNAVRWRDHDFEGIHNSKKLNESGEKEVNDFFGSVKKESDLVSNSFKTMLPILSCMTQMMDQGDVSLKARAKLSSSGKVEFYSAVRTTEMSLALMPRNILQYYPEFFRLAQFYWQDRDFAKRVEKYFREILFVDAPEKKDEKIIEDAKFFADLIYKNPEISKSMLNWKILYES